jgi:peptide-methionine (S)-S-oxide reductase
VILTLALALTLSTSTRAGVPVPEPTVDDMLAATRGSSSVVLAGGCFWGVEEIFQHLRGVTAAVSGYSGGSTNTADYELVSSGTTGHAEVVKVTYDPSRVSLGTLLKVFFSVVHDPTEVNRQGPDVGPQYRSAIFYGNERQQTIARAYIDQLTAARVYRRPIATQLVALRAFYEAESYHQDYAMKNPFDRYIMQVDKPRVDDFKRTFPQLLNR